MTVTEFFSRVDLICLFEVVIGPAGPISFYTDANDGLPDGRLFSAGGHRPEKVRAV